MYFNIYQISQNPIPAEEWITESDFYFSVFLGEIANKVDSVTDREERITELGNWLRQQGLGSIQGNKLTLNPDMLEKPYYAERYEKFKEAAQTLSRVSRERYLEDLDGIRNMISEIEEQVIETRSHYVCWDSEDPIPLDEFLRTAVCGKPYYIGGVCKFQY